MASRIRGRRIIDIREEGRLAHTPGEEDRSRKDVPELERPRRRRERIVTPFREEHKHVMPWAIVE
jgi:hypothetical protein